MGWLSRLLGRRPTGVAEIEGSGAFECEVVGESKYQDALDVIAGGKTEDGHEIYCDAELIPEPRNRHDSNAIMVMIKGQLVGYLSRGHAVQLAKIMRQRDLAVARAHAVIVGGGLDVAAEGLKATTG